MCYTLILILWYYGQNVSTSMITFNNQANCEQAAHSIHQNVDNQYAQKAVTICTKNDNCASH